MRREFSGSEFIGGHLSFSSGKNFVSIPGMEPRAIGIGSGGVTIDAGRFEDVYKKGRSSAETSGLDWEKMTPGAKWSAVITNAASVDEVYFLERERLTVEGQWKLYNEQGFVEQKASKVGQEIMELVGGVSSEEIKAMQSGRSSNKTGGITGENNVRRDSGKVRRLVKLSGRQAREIKMARETISSDPVTGIEMTRDQGWIHRVTRGHFAKQES